MDEVEKPEPISYGKRMAIRVDHEIERCPAFSDDPAKEAEQIPDECVEDCPVYLRCWKKQEDDPEIVKNGVELLEKVEEESG